MYFRRNGNGGFELSNTLIAGVTLALIILSTFSSAVAYSVGVSRSATRALADVQDLKLDLKAIEDEVNDNTKGLAVTQVQYENIMANIEDLKEIVKNDLHNCH